jgi:hypothetical protein
MVQGSLLERMYQSCTTDPQADCNIQSVLAFVQVDATHVRATFISASYSNNSTGVPVPSPAGNIGQFHRPGDTMLISVDQYHRLVAQDEGRLSNGNLNADGTRVDTQYFCGPQTDSNQKLLCGA